MIEAIEGEVIELGPLVAGGYIRVRVQGPGERRVNLWLPTAQARGMALGTRVRVLVEVVSGGAP